MHIVKYLFYLSALIFALGQLTSLTVPAYPEVRVHLLDVLVGLTVGVWIIQYFLRAKPLTSSKGISPLKLNFLAQSILLFIGISVISLLVNIGNYETHQLVIGSLYLVRFAVHAGLYFVVRDLLTLSKPGRVRWTSDTRGFLPIAVGVASAILGLLQFFLYPNLRNLKYLGWDPHLNRAFGTFLDPQFLGIILVLTLLLAFSGLKDLKLGYLLRKKPSFLFTIAVFITLLLTYSRSSYLALVVGLGILGMLGKVGKARRLGYLGILGNIGIISALILLLFKPQGVAGDLLRSETAISRIESWGEAIEIWQEKPILGVGFNMLRYARSTSTSGDSLRETPDVLDATSDVVSAGVSHSAAGVDNSFLFVLATTGVVGFVAYLNIWRVLLGKITGSKLAIAAAVFTHALFNNTLFYPWVLWWVWVFYSSSGE